MSAWHKNLPPHKAAQQIAMAEKIKAFFHVCFNCRTHIDGEINWDCPPGSPTLRNLCDACHPLPRS